MDVLLLALVAGGATFQPAPFDIEGLFLQPPIETLCSQTTGDGASTLRVRRSAGRVRCVDSVTDYNTTEDAVATSSGHAFQVNDTGTKLASGNAVWFTAVAVQHRPAGSVSILYVPGTVAALASAAVPTTTEVQDFLGDGVVHVIIGDVLFYRSADTVIDVQISNERRPAYVHPDNKTGVVADQADQASLAGEFCCFMDIPIELISTSAVSDAGLYIDGLALPNLPFGGYVKDWRYRPTKVGTNAGATNTLRLALDGVDMTGNDLTITLALSAIGQVVNGDGSFSGSTNIFKSGATLDVKVVSSATDFTAGQGFLQVEIWKYVQ